MMTKPRDQQICLSATPYYHCISRCVRRAFLCGDDNTTGKNFDHRKQWIEDRLMKLIDVFAIELCAYAIMSNHTHLVLYINQEKAQSWSTEDVLFQWHQLFKGTLLTQQYMSDARNTMVEACIKTVEETADSYRERLTNISWFMKALNEPLARMANKEDECTGRFWEGRFKSQALLDESALIACMAYVDLNPIRAGIHDSLETSDFTSIQQRVAAVKAKKHQPSYLLPLSGNSSNKNIRGIPFSLKDYIQLVDDTGRIQRNDKRGKISENNLRILHRLGLSPEQWLEVSQHIERHFTSAFGKVAPLTHYCEEQGLKRRATIQACQTLLG